MYKTLKFALYSLRKNKMQAVMNICGLSLGLGICIAVAVTILSITSMDKFHKNQETLFKVICTEEIRGGQYSDATSALLGPQIKNDIPEIKDYCRYFWANELLLGWPENFVNENGFYADKTIFKLLSFPLIKGEYDRLFMDKRSIAISENMATKLFGTENPINKSINLYTYNENKPVRFTVNGVFKNIPDLSTLKFEFVIPYEYFISKNPGLNSWNNIGTRTFIQLNETTDPQQIGEKMTNVIAGNNGHERKKTFGLAPIHKSSQIVYTLDGKPFIGFFAIMALGIIGLSILIVSIINFINLSIASSIKRINEVCVKKVNGAGRCAIIAQFFTETSLIVIISGLLGVFIQQQIMGIFELDTHPDLFLFNHQLLYVLPFVLIFTILLAAWYPSLHITSFNPAKMLKGPAPENPGVPSFRAILVIVQFIIAIILITSSLVLSKQVNYIYSNSLNVDRDNLIYFKKNIELDKHRDAFKQELHKKSGIESVSFVDQPASMIVNSTTSVSWEGKEPNDTKWYAMMNGAEDFAKTFRLRVLEGRDFSSKYTGEDNKILINEAAAKEMNLNNPVGQTIKVHGQNVEIVGMIENFSFQFLASEKKPVFIRYRPEQAYLTMVRLQEGAEKAGIASLKKTFSKFSPDFILDYTYLDESFNQRHQFLASIKKMISLSGYFAIFIACIGLLGLVIHSSERRTKELGIRKISGARVTDIITVLSTQSLKWLFTALIIGFPLSFLMMKKILQLFPIRIKLDIFPFLYSLIGIVGITIMIISWQIWKVANKNPVEALRYE